MKARPNSNNPSTLRGRRHRLNAQLKLMRLDVWLSKSDVELLADKVEDKRPGGHSRTIDPREWKRDVEAIVRVIVEQEARSLITKRRK